MIKQITDYLINRGFSPQVDVAIILGSGLGGFAEKITDAVMVPYDEIPGFPEVTVAGHGGNLYQGHVNGKKVLAFSGRFHHYEGHSFERTLIPVRLAAAMNARLLIVSNAAGGINTRFQVGDLMLIDDIMRAGFPVLPFGTLATTRYNNRYIVEDARRIAISLDIDVRQGTYLYVKGPVYETKAEIRAYRYIGADAVGMSTVPELLEANNFGMDSLAISLITNMATGVAKHKLEHAEIKEVADSRKDEFAKLIGALIEQLSN